MAEKFIIFRETGAVSGDESKWVEGTISTTGEPFIDMPSKLFYTGIHKRETFDEGRLDRLVASFAEPASDRDWSVPGQLDHSESSRDTIGSLRKVWRTGQDLWGTARFVGEEAVRKAKNGTWRKLSLSVYPRSDRIREFSVTPFPQLAGASTFSEETESEDDMAKATASTTTEAPAVTPVAPTDDKPTNYAEEAIARIRQEFSEKTAALESRLEMSEQKNDSLEKVVRFNEMTFEIEKFSKAGKTAPVMRQVELELIQTFSDSQIELYRKLKEVQPVVVDTRVLGDQDPEAVANFKATLTEEVSDEDVDADAAKYA